MIKPNTPTYKTLNWPSYNEALKRRGSLTVWFDPDMAWAAKLTSCCPVAARLRGPKRRSVNYFPLSVKNRPDPDWAGPFQIAQESAGVGGGLGFEDPDEDPAGCPVNGHEQVVARGFVSHLRQILDVHMQVTGLVGFERLVLRSGVLRLQVAQIADPVPT
jgi:hypothetical protein